MVFTPAGEAYIKGQLAFDDYRKNEVQFNEYFHKPLSEDEKEDYIKGYCDSRDQKNKRYFQEIRKNLAEFLWENKLFLSVHDNKLDKCELWIDGDFYDIVDIVESVNKEQKAKYVQHQTKIRNTLEKIKKWSLTADELEELMK